MRYLLNVLYICALVLLSPFLVYRMLTTRKYRRGLWHKRFKGPVNGPPP